MSGSSNLSAGDIERMESNYDALLFKLAAIEAAGQETTPGAVIDRLMDGEAPLSVWREHRGLTREALAEAADIGVDEITTVERGGELGLRKMVALAKTLRIEAEDLLPWLE